MTATGHHIDLVNMYVVPGHLATRVWEPKYLPSTRHALICADLNAFHANWASREDERLRDGVVHSDGVTRGRRLAGWAGGAQMVPLNDGSTTRIGTRAAGGIARTAPDVTFVSKQCAEGCKWTVLKDGGSDHRPICVDVPFYDPGEVPERPKRWALKKADWAAYRAETERGLERIPAGASVEQLSERFEAVVLQAAAKSVPRGNGRARPKPWWTPEVEAAVRRRQRAEAQLDGSGAAQRLLTEAREEAEAAIRDGKRASWHEYLAKVDAGKSHFEDLWRIVKVVSGTLPAARPNPVLRGDERQYVTPAEKAAALAAFYERECTLAPATAEQLERRLTERLRTGAAAGPQVTTGGAARHLATAEQGQLERRLTECARTGAAAGPQATTGGAVRHLATAEQGQLKRRLTERLRTGAAAGPLAAAAMLEREQLERRGTER
eukprot:gene5309-4864_t